jgi:hypothetical protein
MKSFLDVADKTAGADAVTAVKLAVDGAVIDVEVLKNCFLKYVFGSDTLSSI